MSGLVTQTNQKGKTSGLTQGFTFHRFTSTYSNWPKPYGCTMIIIECIGAGGGGGGGSGNAGVATGGGGQGGPGNGTAGTGNTGGGGGGAATPGSGSNSGAGGGSGLVIIRYKFQ